MTPSPETFLSYTRLDDEYFGGAITSLRRLLELGVQVVTGDRTLTFSKTSTASNSVKVEETAHRSDFDIQVPYTNCHPAFSKE